MINLNPEGRYYHPHWMARRRLPMLPWWLVGWFIGPLTAWQLRRDRARKMAERHDVKGDDDSPF
jgi:hypothetical protein